MVEALIAGTMDIPDDVDDVTALIIDEISQLGMKLVAGNGEEIPVSPDDFKRYWKQAREKTNSSMSLVHFGHYKAATTSDRVSAFLAKKITVIARSSCPPKRWGSGLQLMLEKIAGIALINKLQAILLMEVDYNFNNKFIFGHLALNKLLKEGCVPEEQYSQRESTAEDAKMDSRLTYDISRQLRQPMGSTSADAANCYDRINHIFMAFLIFAITGWVRNNCISAHSNSNDEVLPADGARRLNHLHGRASPGTVAARPVSGEWHGPSRMDNDHGCAHALLQARGIWSKHSHANHGMDY